MSIPFFGALGKIYLFWSNLARTENVYVFSLNNYINRLVKNKYQNDFYDSIKLLMETNIQISSVNDEITPWL